MAKNRTRQKRRALTEGEHRAIVARQAQLADTPDLSGTGTNIGGGMADAFARNTPMKVTHSGIVVPQSTSAPVAIDAQLGTIMSPEEAEAHRMRDAQTGQGAVFIDPNAPAPAQQAAPQQQAAQPTLDDAVMANLDVGNLGALGLTGRGGAGGPRKKLTKTQQFNAPIDPRIAQQAQQAGEQAQQARRELTETEAGGAAQTADLLGQTAETLDAIAAQQNQRRQEFQTRINDIEAQYAKLNEEVGNFQEDPERFYASKSTGAKIGMVLASALAGAGAALSRRGGNPALEAINRAVDRDIQAQRAGVAAKRGQLAGVGKLLDQTRAVFSDDQAALMATKALYLERARTQLNQLASSSQSDEIRARANALEAQLAEQAAGLQVQAAQRQAGQIQIETIQRTGGGRRRPSVKELLDLRKRALQNAKLEQELRGGGGRAETIAEGVQSRPDVKLSSGEKKAIRESLSDARQTLGNLKELEKLRKKMGFLETNVPGVGLISGDRAKFDSLRANFQLAAQSALVKGVASDAELKLIKNLANARTAGEMKQGATALRSVIKRGVKARLQGVTQPSAQIKREFGISGRGSGIQGFKPKN